MLRSSTSKRRSTPLVVNCALIPDRLLTFRGVAASTALKRSEGSPLATALSTRPLSTPQIDSRGGSRRHVWIRHLGDVLEVHPESSSPSAHLHVRTDDQNPAPL